MSTHSPPSRITSPYGRERSQASTDAQQASSTSPRARACTLPGFQFAVHTRRPRHSSLPPCCCEHELAHCSPGRPAGRRAGTLSAAARYLCFPPSLPSMLMNRRKPPASHPRTLLWRFVAEISPDAGLTVRCFSWRWLSSGRARTARTGHHARTRGAATSRTRASRGRALRCALCLCFSALLNSSALCLRRVRRGWLSADSPWAGIDGARVGAGTCL